MKAKELTKLDRSVNYILFALDGYMLNLCGKRYDWNTINLYHIPLINGNYKGNQVQVTFNLPGRKVKYWLNGKNVEVDNYYSYDSEDMAMAVSEWNGRNFLGEFDFFI